MRKTIPALVSATLLAGCASTTSTVPSARPVAAPRPATPNLARPVAQSGAVTGQTADGLIRLFGQPALDVQEGTARKLQFAGSNCVLDAYLYPRGGRGEPVVTHVDVRLPDGRDSDRNACIGSLRRR